MKQTPAGRSGGSRWNDDNNKEAKVFHDYLERLAAAGTANEIAKVRVDIADAVTAGKLTEVAADSLQACARAAAESIAAHGERRPSKPAPAPAPGVRLPAVIREAIARTRNAIVALSLRQCAIHPTSIGDVFDASAELGLSAADVLRPRHLHAVTQRAAGRAAQQPE